MLSLRVKPGDQPAAFIHRRHVFAEAKKKSPAKVGQGGVPVNP
jgi:hypothetical protein